MVHETPQSLVLPFSLHQVSGHFRRGAGGDLVHEFPQSLAPPFPLHQVSGPFRPLAGGDLVHETPQSLVPPLSLHQVSGPVRRPGGGDLVHETPQALVPPFPLHQVSGHFRRGAGGDLVHETPQSLAPPFPLHQVSGPFRPVAGQVGAWLPAKPYSTVRPRQHRRRFPAAGALDPEDVVLGDEGIRAGGERHTTSSQPTCAGQEPPAPLRSGHRAPLHSHRPPGLFLRLCFSSIYKKGIMKWPDWRAADSGKGKGREASNL